MLSFCGMDECAIDANGRIKLSPRVIADFAATGKDLVLHCLPEGAVAVYPENIYLKMRSSETEPAGRAANSFVFRQTSRRFGAWSQTAQISPQGRITLPPAYRAHAGLKGEIYVVGVEIGIEIWDRKRWDDEQKKFTEHVLQKGEMEMKADLNGGVPENV